MSHLPVRQQRWELSGAGMENLALAEREIPRPAADELLVRIDACGVCFSDIKILNLGPAHPRLQGRDLRAEPVVMGHETAMTVVEVGETLRERFRPGQRFLIQADVYFQGQGMAFGGAWDGLPSLLQQDGWSVEFRDWYADSKPPLPRKIFASKPPYTVRLLIEQWRIQ